MPNTKSVKEAYRDRTVIHPLSSFPSKNVAKAYKDRSVIHPMSSFQSKIVAKAYKDRSVIYPMSAFSKNKTSKPLTNNKTIVPLPSTKPKPAPTFPVVPNPINATIENLGRSIVPTIPSRTPTPPAPPQPTTNRLPSPPPRPPLSTLSIPSYLPPHPLDLGKHLPSSLPANEEPITIFIYPMPQPTEHQYTITNPSALLQIATIQTPEPQVTQPASQPHQTPEPQPNSFFNEESQAAFRQEIEAMFNRVAHPKLEPSNGVSAKANNAAPKNNPVSTSYPSTLEAEIVKKDQEQIKELDDISKMIEEPEHLLASTNQQLKESDERHKKMQQDLRNLSVPTSPPRSSRIASPPSLIPSEAEFNRVRNQSQMLSFQTYPDYFSAPLAPSAEFGELGPFGFFTTPATSTLERQTTNRKKDGSRSALQRLGDKAANVWTTIKHKIGLSSADQDKTKNLRFPVKTWCRNRLAAQRTLTAAKPTQDEQSQSAARLTMPSRSIPAPQPKYPTKPSVDSSIPSISSEEDRLDESTSAIPVQQTSTAIDNSQYEDDLHSLPPAATTINSVSKRRPWILTQPVTAKDKPRWNPYAFVGPRRDAIVLTSAPESHAAPKASNKRPFRWTLPPKSTTPKDSPVWNPNKLLGTRATSSLSNVLPSPTASGHFKEEDYQSRPTTVVSEFTESTNTLLESANRNLSRADAREKTARLMDEIPKKFAALKNLRDQYEQFLKQKKMDKDLVAPPPPSNPRIELIPARTLTAHSSSLTAAQSKRERLNAYVEDNEALYESLQNTKNLKNALSRHIKNSAPAPQPPIQTRDTQVSSLAPTGVSSIASSSSTTASTIIPSTFTQPSRLVDSPADSNNQPPRLLEEPAISTQTNQAPEALLDVREEQTFSVRSNGRNRNQQPTIWQRLFGTTQSNLKWWSGIRSSF